MVIRYLMAVFIAVHVMLMSQMIPFYLPWNDTNATVADISFLNHKPAGVFGRVTAGSDGHLYAGGTKIKFLGMNFSAHANFPAKADADVIARRLAKFGVNAVRLHFMDADQSACIFGTATGTRNLSAARLDALDYFVSKLKENGVYVDINLWVGRNPDVNDGLPASVSSIPVNAAAFYYPTLITLQKEYATKLLNRVNPYTGVSYMNDPAVLCIEIKNESSFLRCWNLGNLDTIRNTTTGVEFRTNLTALWNAFLVSKYTNHTALASAWSNAGRNGLAAGENLASGNINLFSWAERTNTTRTSPGVKDWIRFLMQVDDKYWATMRDHIKTTLGCQALVLGTAAGFSTPSIQGALDIVDNHSYWQHPSFPGASFDAANWYVKNSSVLREGYGGTATQLAMTRVFGKPYFVTEYNHPTPNTYAAEGYLYMFAYAAMQDWDGVFAYTYQDFNTNWTSQHNLDWFDISQDPHKMAGLIIGALMFRRGDVQPALGAVYANTSKSIEADKFQVNGYLTVSGGELGMKRQVASVMRAGVVLEGNTPPTGGVLFSNFAVPASPYTAATGEISLDTTTGVLTVNTLKTKVLSGFVCNKDYSLGGITFNVRTNLQNFAAIGMSVVSEPSGTNNVTRMLLVVMGALANQNMSWYLYPSTAAAFPPPVDQNITVRDAWGNGPTIVEGIVADVTVPYAGAAVSVRPLNGLGVPSNTTLPQSTSNNTTKFQVSGSYRTIWYEVTINHAVAPLVVVTPSQSFTNTLTIAMSVDKDYGYWSTNGITFTQFSTNGTSLNVNRTVTLTYYGSSTNGNTSATNTAVYTLDNSPPAINGLVAGVTTNKSFMVNLTVNENYGYWSTNGTTFAQFTTNGASITIDRTLTLRCCGRDALGNTSATNTASYVFDTNAPVISGAPAGFTTNTGFIINLSVNEHYGYWSTNGTTYTQFTTNGTSIAIDRTITLRYYGRDAVGNATVTNVRTYIVGAGYPNTPGTLNASAVSANTVRLSWVDTSTNEQAFHIYRGTNTVTYALVGTAPANTTNFIDASLAYQTRYYYLVSSTNPAGESSPAGPDDIYTAVTLSAGALSAVIEPLSNTVRFSYAVTKNCTETVSSSLIIAPAGSGSFTALPGMQLGPVVFPVNGMYTNRWIVPPGFDTSVRYDVKLVPTAGPVNGDAAVWTNIDLSAMFSAGDDMTRVCAVGSPSRDGEGIRFMNAPRDASVYVYSISGKLLARIGASSDDSPLRWDVRCADGRRAAPGVYVCQVYSRAGSAVVRVMVAR